MLQGDQKAPATGGLHCSCQPPRPAGALATGGPTALATGLHRQPPRPAQCPCYRGMVPALSPARSLVACATGGPKACCRRRQPVACYRGPRTPVAAVPQVLPASCLSPSSLRCSRHHSATCAAAGTILGKCPVDDSDSLDWPLFARLVRLDPPGSPIPSPGIPALQGHPAQAVALSSY